MRRYVILTWVLVDWKTALGRLQPLDLTNYPLDRLYDECPTICGHGPKLLLAVCESVYFLDSRPSPTRLPAQYFVR